jgi:hypothetical protein
MRFSLFFFSFSQQTLAYYLGQSTIISCKIISKSSSSSYPANLRYMLFIAGIVKNWRYKDFIAGIVKNWRYKVFIAGIVKNKNKNKHVND